MEILSLKKGDILICRKPENIFYGSKRLSTVGELFRVTMNEAYSDADACNHFQAVSLSTGEDAMLTTRNFDYANIPTGCEKNYEAPISSAVEALKTRIEQLQSELEQSKKEHKTEDIISQQVVGCDIVTTIKRKGEPHELREIEILNRKRRADRLKRTSRRFAQREERQIEGACQKQIGSSQTAQGNRSGDSRDEGSFGRRSGRPTGLNFNSMRDVTPLAKGN